MKTPLIGILRGEKRIPERRPRPWEALSYRDFRLLWSGLFFSSLGFWMQFTSLTYLVGVVLANSASQSAINLAILGAARSVPVLALAPLAGYVADRYPRRRTLFLTNFVRALLAFALAFVSQFHGMWVIVAVIAIAGALSGVQSFDSPARQSWVSFLVPRHLLSNAIGLNSFASNLPLMVGPALAGLLISTLGVYASFYIQAFAQLPVVVAVMLMRPAPLAETSRESVLSQFASSIRFVLSHEVLRWVVFLLLVTCLCVRPYNWLLATLAGHVLHVDARAYGTMLAVGGIGTVTGAITVTVSRSETRARMWFASGAVSAIGLLFLGYVHDFVAVLVLLAVMGWGSMSFVSLTNVAIQTYSPEDMRGRTMSLYSMLLIGLVPVGTLMMGALGSVTGIPLSYAVGGALGLLIGTWLWLAYPVLRRA